MNKVSYNKVRLSLAVLLCLCTISMVDAKVKLPALISDRMVLQREQSIKVWGMADAGKNTVTTRLISNSGYPHFVQEKPYKIICGNEEVSLLGEWKYRLGTAMPPAPGMMFFCYKPICLYNAMIADWHRTFNNPGLPFHIVELADFLSKDDIGGRQAWAEMRREQARVTETIINN